MATTAVAHTMCPKCILMFHPEPCHARNTHTHTNSSNTQINKHWSNNTLNGLKRKRLNNENGLTSESFGQNSCAHKLIGSKLLSPRLKTFEPRRWNVQRVISALNCILPSIWCQNKPKVLPPLLWSQMHRESSK